jgi:hypothetical protein
MRLALSSGVGGKEDEKGNVRNDFPGGQLTVRRAASGDWNWLRRSGTGSRRAARLPWPWLHLGRWLLYEWRLGERILGSSGPVVRVGGYDHDAVRYHRDFDNHIDRDAHRDFRR